MCTCALYYTVLISDHINHTQMCKDIHVTTRMNDVIEVAKWRLRDRVKADDIDYDRRSGESAHIGYHLSA